LLNIFGVWRWLGRQAKVEEGARTAAQASEHVPSETLFPVSMLTKAPVLVSGHEIGRCVDAMAGCESGRLSYVVVSAGGVAGVGEILRRMPWSAAAARGEALHADLDRDRFEALPELARDEWPAR
jgi:hypothetical protein